MVPLEKTYSGRFFRNRHKLSWRAPHICGVINDIFHPKSVIDVGCAIGDLVKGFWDLNMVAHGIEGSEEVEPYLISEVKNKIMLRDLRKPIELKVCKSLKYDLVTCFEVAEHIEEEYADQFINNITNLSNKILMSFAEPGQKGHSHVNCQPFNYWDNKFFKKGYYYKQEIVDKVLKDLEPWKKKDGIKALFKHQLVYFEKEG